ncbi:MAG: zinc-binding alcohol dehydrogenase family protein [Bacteroidales bacterium]|nr:zinc-binding alcohol dehydrogenase family protein [Bacteroidales bacterium]
MESVVVCSPSLKRLKKENSYFDFTLCDQPMVIGLLKSEDNACSKVLNDHGVLVQIDAFSCNYRDKGLLLTMNGICNENESLGKYSYSAFGSDFVGHVLRVGKAVSTLREGDRVITDATYPFRSNGEMGGIISNHASQRIQLFNENQLIKIPDVLHDIDAASFTVGAQTGYSMVRKCSLQEGDNVLVTSGSSHTSLAVLNKLKGENVNIYVLTSNPDYKKLFPGSEKFIIIPTSSLKDNTFRERIGSIRFDAVIDPFFDLYFEELVNYMNMNGRYVFCGFYTQNKYYSQQINRKHFTPSILGICISKSLSILANCIGERKDLENALCDYENNKYTLNIDSVYRGEDILPFLQKSFHQLPRFGKVVYQY